MKERDYEKAIQILKGDIQVNNDEMLIARATGIYAIQEYLRYREIGTVEEFKAAMNTQKP